MAYRRHKSVSDDLAVCVSDDWRGALLLPLSVWESAHRATIPEVAPDTGAPATPGDKTP